MLFAMFHAQIYVLTCLHVQIYMLQALCHVFLCFVPLFVLGRHQGYMLTCLFDVVGYALLGSMCFMCLFPCYMVRSMFFTCLYAWIHVLPCLCVKFLHIYMHTSTLICLDLCFHMLVCLDLCSLHALCYRLCACALHAMFVCLDLDYVCHAICYCSPFVTLFLFLMLWPNGQDQIQTL